MLASANISPAESSAAAVALLAMLREKERRASRTTVSTRCFMAANRVGKTGRRLQTTVHLTGRASPVPSPGTRKASSEASPVPSQDTIYRCQLLHSKPRIERTS